jgi:hypothetical protein
MTGVLSSEIATDFAGRITRTISRDFKFSRYLYHDSTKFSEITIYLVQTPIARTRTFGKHGSAVQLLTPRIDVGL